MATIYCTATSLDGFIADDAESLGWLMAVPNSDSDPNGRYGDSDNLDYEKFIQNVGSLVMGSHTLEWMQREASERGAPFEWPYSQPSWVVTSRAPDQVDVPEGIHRFSGDVRELHPQLVEAASGKDVWVVGGGELAGQFMDAGLLDLVWVHLCPVTLGAGKPLLPRRVRLHRRAIERDGQLTAMLFDVVGPEPRGGAEITIATT